ASRRPRRSPSTPRTSSKAPAPSWRSASRPSAGNESTGSLMRCASCSRPVADDARRCPACGAAVDLPSTPTGTAPRGPRSESRKDSGPVAGRFVPGTLLAQRFRIVGLVGKGGMGEVYRADDLKLGQTIALKFLPEDLQHDADRLARFYNEVRVARQITHPNVCRVHDVDELDGLHFLSMEYVDGENLASLL